MASRTLFVFLVAACTIQVLTAFHIPRLLDVVNTDDVLAKLEKLSQEAESAVHDFSANLQKKVEDSSKGNAGTCTTAFAENMKTLEEEAVNKAKKCVQDAKNDIEKNEGEDLLNKLRMAEMCVPGTVQGLAVKADPDFKKAMQCAQNA